MEPSPTPSTDCPTGDILAAPPPAAKFRWRGLALLLSLLACLLSGCFQYDLGIQFDSQTHGQIVQQIRLTERAAALGGSAVKPWLSGLENQVRRLGGQVHRPDSDTVRLVVPFSNGAELTQRFSQLFHSQEPEGLAIADLATVPSQFSLTQQNRVFAIRNHLICDLDLRALPRQPENLVGVLGGTADWLDLRFTLQVPWGLRQVDASAEPTSSGGTAQSWPLEPGALNHIDVVFWVPSPLGLGALAIAALVLLGYFFKYGLRRGRHPIQSQ